MAGDLQRALARLRIQMARISADALQRAIAEGRRAATRYALALEVRYALLRHGAPPLRGVGQTVNISVAGLLFRSDARAHPGDSIVVAVAWPVTAPNSEPLYLVISGHVVRSRRPLVAIAIGSKRLLRASELDERFNLFFGQPGPAGVPAERQLAVVDESAAVLFAISDALPAAEWIVKGAEGDTVRWILETYGTEVGLVITRNPGLLDGIPPTIPVLLTVDDNAPEDCSQFAQRPRLAVLRRSASPPRFLDVVNTLCRPSTGLPMKTPHPVP